MISLLIVTLSIVSLMLWALYQSPHLRAQRAAQRAALARLIKRADKQHTQILFGNEKAGTYGIFPPAVDLDAHDPEPPSPPPPHHWQ